MGSSLIRVLVCGATGFIGHNLAESFAGRDGYEVHAVYHKQPAWDHPGLRFVEADLTRAEDVRRVVAGMDVIIQAAATTSGVKDISQRPFIHVTDNAVMNSLLFREAHELGVGHVVFFSCSVMYQSGQALKKETDFNPADEIHPRYFGVGWTKVYIEKMAEFYARLGRTRYTVLRHSNIYGPHDKFDLERSHVFGATMTKVLTATDGKVRVWGTGQEARDLLHVDDLVDFVERALERQRSPFELINVGSGRPVTVRALVESIIAASGRELRIEHDLDGPSIATSLGLDCTRARELFGWVPRIPLDQGIRLTMDWWREHIGRGKPS